MDILLFAFANNPDEHLPTLRKEEEMIRRVLLEGQLKQRYLLVNLSMATRAEITYYLSLFRENLVLFHYAGHAGRDVLFTEEEESQVEGIIHLLGQCPKLKFVFLNGCSTASQVESLWKAGVPGILATSNPVNDYKATDFSGRFYQALSFGDSAEAAFQAAKGELMSQDSSIDIQIHRGIGRLPSFKGKALWDFFLKEGDESVANFCLPQKTTLVIPEDFSPNAYLIPQMISILAPYNRIVRRLKEDEENGEEVDLPDKNVAILNCLPAPLAEQIRKLLVPLSEQDLGYEKISRTRVAQILRTYNAMIELLAFIMLAQLWRAIEENSSLVIPEEERTTIQSFLQIGAEERKTYNYIALIQSIRRVFDNHQIKYFVEELAGLKDAYAKEGPFVYACHFFESLRQRLYMDALSDLEIPEYCRKAEYNLMNVMRELGFMAKYTLVAVGMIEAIKYRHFATPKFLHSLLPLVKIMGGRYEEKPRELNNFLDSRSVILLKDKGKEGYDFLNLSPFIFDKNAFEPQRSMSSNPLSHIFYFHHSDPEQGLLWFKPVNKPEDSGMVVSSSEFAIIKEQMDAFSSLLFSRKIEDL